MSANTTATSELTGALVFVVDDNELLGEITAQLISSAGYRTRLFHQGRPARDAMLTAPVTPRVLVTDFDIGDINGLDLIREARAHLPGIKTLLVSGTAAPEALAAHPIKPDAFLAKPFLAATLIGTVDQLLTPSRATV
ncbi:MAG: response regulator [Verrucomicrobia bacterium]|nr:response regulator [Verrucomicrobiota bacterium]NBU08882.1 response regulator [Pseudomonadota bacterium]NDA68009.1 response regulator [Verrucomicrobiota bacterium]NDB77046.1 response regulator [Verrucomicrobiota bacterium]NDD37305.1 response regulator [Verrucomicrobiota bacterium]